MIIRCNCKEVDISALWAFRDDFFMKVEIIVIDELIERVQVAKVISVGEGIAEGKVDLFLLFPKMKIKDTL